MTPSRLVRVFALFLLCVTSSIATAATTEFRVFLDNDPNGGCSVNGMDGVDRVLVTQINDASSPAQVTRVFRQDCMGVALGSPTDLSGTPWNATFNTTNRLLTFETRVPFMAFGTNDMPANVIAGFQISRLTSSHTVLLTADGSFMIVPQAPSRRRAIDFEGQKHITLDGLLADWSGVSPLTFGSAGSGSQSLRLLRVLAYADPNEKNLYFAGTAYIDSNYPVADDDLFLRDPDQGLSVPTPGVLANDSDPQHQTLHAQKVSDPQRGSIVLNDDGSFTYSPNHPQAMASDEFEYKVVAGGRESNTARVRISVDNGESPKTPNDDQYTTPENTVLNVAAPGVLDNDPDKLVKTTVFAAPAHGTVDLHEDGGFKYTPFTDFVGTDSFVYTATKKNGNNASNVESNAFGGNATVTITVTEVISAPDAQDDNYSVAEDGTLVVPQLTGVLANDSDPNGDSLTATPVPASGPAHGTLTWNPSLNGSFTYQPDADYFGSDQFSYTVSDGAETDTAVVNINVTPVNDPPSFTGGGDVSTNEDTPYSAAWATAISKGPSNESSQVLTFTVTPVNPALFSIPPAINTSTGVLSFTPAANANGTTSVTATLSDNGGGSSSSAPVIFNITILAVNDQPAVNTATFSLPENSPNATVVGTATFTDPDAGQNHTFAITAGNTGGAFTINATTGQITVANSAALDFETNPTFSLTVSVTDDSGAGNATGTNTVTVNLTNVNEAPVANDATFGVDENSANGTAVGTVTASEPDAGQTLTYAITAGNTGGAFAINPSTGAITVANTINFESLTSYVLTVTVTDNGAGNLSDTAAITINVNNLNEAPVVNAATFPLPENSPNGTSVGTVTFTEPDTTGQTHTFAITAGNTGNAFAINPATGEITVNDVNAVNFEATPSFSLTVSVTDAGAPAPPLSGSATITINLTDVNENPVVNDQSFNVNENVPNGTVVGTVAATDQDAGQTLTYAITAGNTGGAFAINPSTGQITVANAINYETLSSYALTVTVTDNGAGNLSDTATVTINVNDVNEPPTVTPAGPFAINENSANGTVVFTAAAVDPDGGQTLTWSITGGNTGGAFAINPGTGQVTVANSTAVDFETNPTFSLTVQAQDNGAGTLSDTEVFVINVTNLNEAPVVNPATFSIPENSPNGTTVGTATYTEPDGVGQTHTFSITGGNTGGAFAIDPSTGIITVANVAAVDFETTPTFSLTVSVLDNGVPPLSGSNTVTVNLTDANEPPVVNDQAFAVDENVAIGTVVGSIAFSDPDGPTDTFAITSGNAGGEFAVNPSTGQITTAAALNFEAAASYNFTITISDAGTPLGTDTAVITININNLNEAPVVNPATFPLAENSANATVVGTVTFTEPDTTGQTHTFAITGGNTGGAFAINSGSGQITVANSAAVNFETTPTFSLTVQVTDAGAPAPPMNGTATITINLTNVNDTPVYNDASRSIAENSPNGTNVGAPVTATDEDAGQTLTYAITAGNTGGAFAINSSTGQITVANPINFESLNSYSLTVTATDNGPGTLSDTATVTITVLDVNEPPTVTPAGPFAINENSANGTVVFTAAAVDPDGGQTLTWSITGGNTGGAFAINPGTGQVTVANSTAVDFETNPTFSLTVQAQDNGAGTLSDTEVFVINVTNLNEAPVVNPATFSIPENSPNGTTVGTATYTEPDGVGQTHTFSITGGNTGGAFAIDPSTGIITVANVAAVDFETTPTFSLTVSVLDNGVPPLSGSNTVTVNLTDANEPPVVNDQAFAVDENVAIGTVVGSIAFSDPDGPTDTFAITSGNAGGEFAVNPSTGQITTAAALNFEAAASYNFTITISDAGTPLGTDTAVITININNLNEAPVVNPATFPLAENSANATVVGTVTFTEPDTTGQTHTFAITGGNTGGAFAINSGSGQITVANSAAVNFETTPTFSLTVQVTDAGAPAPPMNGTATITINLTNVNDTPVYNDASRSIAENSPNGTNVGAPVTATDEDAGQTLTYAITAGNTGGAFAINSSTGQITVANPINFESLNSYSLTVTATDNGPGTLSDTATVTITVLDVNEPPVANDATFGINENVPNGTVVGTVSATDPDTGQTLTYAITAGNTGGAFAINPGSGQITVANTINFEAVSSYSLTVTVTDNGPGTLSDTAAITINITNLNEAPVVNPAGPFSLPENSPNATLVGTPITFTEPDTTGQTHTYAITGGNTGGAFAIDSSGQISVATSAAVNFEVNPTFTLTVQVTDAGAPAPPMSGTTSVTINLTNVNDVPVYNDATRSIAENSPNGTNVGAPVTASDEDTGQTLSYAITAGNTGGAFAINSSTGQITVANPINFETLSSYSLTVTATDNGAPIQSDTATVTINVTDVNEAPTANDATFAINENVPNGTVVGSVVATDPDTTAPNNTLSYAITAGNTGGAFAINSANGQITVANTINYEALSSYSLTVTVTDGGAGPLSDTATITINVTDLNEAPTATTDAYSALANTTLHIVGTIVVPVTTVAKTGDVDNTAGHPRVTGLKANDTDPDTNPAFNTLTITFVTGNAGPVAVPGTTTTAHGNITLNADGSFLYTPGSGYIGADSFTYTLNDALNNVTGTVNLTVVGPVVWYVKNDVAGVGSGTSADPYQVLATAITASAANSYVYVMRGNGTATNYGGSNLMKAGQKLWGQNVSLSLTSSNGVVLTNLIAATSHSLIGPGVGANETVKLTDVAGVDIQGLSINGGTTNAIDLTTTGGNSGGFSASGNIITAATLQGIQVSHGGTGTATVDIQNNNITSTGSGIDIARTAGTMTVVTSNNTINSGATGILIAGGAAASSTVTGFLTNSISSNNVGTGINISNVTFDTVAGGAFTQVNGGNTSIGASGNGVGGSGLILNTVAGDLAFTDLDVFADNGTGISIIGTGAGNIAAGTGTSVTVPAAVAVVEAVNGPAVSVNNATVDLRLSSAKSTNTATTGISLTSVSDGTVTAARFSAGSGSSLTIAAGAAGPLFNVSGGNAGISFAGTINNSSTAARAVSVDSLAMDDAVDDFSLTGAITEGGLGILFNNNSGASRTINISGGMTINTTTGQGFAATSNTNTGGLNITGTNTINSVSATALRVSSTTIGASGLTFQSISSGNATAAADPVNGIVLNATGATAGLTVTGTGAANSGGTIQNTTGDGISLTSTRSPSFARMNINTTTGSGIKGTTVTNFSLTNSTINNSNSGNPEDGNVNFSTATLGTETNLSGSVTITGNTLTNSFGHGINILNFNGTITDATISTNVITSSTSIATSKGTGIRIQTTGSAGASSSLTKATISGNTITNFPSAAGIQVQGGNSSTTGPGGTIGIPNDPTNIISITSNLIAGQSAASGMGTSAILAVVSGGNSGSRSQGNFDVSFNGTVANPVRNTVGHTIGCAVNGNATGTFTTNSNVIQSHNTVASNGISGGVGIVASNTETGAMTWTINSNDISATDGNGILAVARGTSGSLKLKIQNNTVAAPLGGKEGIRIDAGNASSLDDSVCLNISGNTSAGTTPFLGIGLRKQGTVSGTNDFGVNGMAATTSPGIETYVNGLNPAGGGAEIISGNNFSNCSNP